MSEVPRAAALTERGWSRGLEVGPVGASHELHVTLTAVRDDDPEGYQLVLVDRTIEVAQERYMERQSRLSALGEALAGVAHELKNPLQIILSYADLGIADAGLPESVRADFRLIQEQGHRMRDMVRELLGFSRDRADVGSFRIEEVTRRVVRMQRMSTGPGIRFDANIAWKGAVHGSGPKTEQILANLLANAAHSVVRGRGVVTVTVVGGAGLASIHVCDNGPGVDPGVRDRIFEPFVTTKIDGEGTGLGLAISRRLAVTMGGDLRLAEPGDSGAELVLELRALESDSNQDPAAA